MPRPAWLSRRCGDLRRHALHSMKRIDPGKLPPWERGRPPGKPTPLSALQAEAARARAAASGRRYPNLVDNMWAAQHVPRDAARPASAADATADLAGRDEDEDDREQGDGLVRRRRAVNQARPGD